MNYIGLIFTVSNLFLLLVFWGVNAGAERYKKNKIFSVETSEKYLQDDRFQEIIGEYKKKNRGWLLFFFITAFLPLYSTPYFSLTFSFFMLWTITVIAFKIIIHASANKSVHAYNESVGYKPNDNESKCWIGGFLYHNPDSEKVWVWNHLNLTFNLATKKGKIYMGGLVLFMVISIGLPWIKIIQDDLRVPQISFSDEKMTIQSAFSSTEIYFDDILQIEYLEKIEVGSKSRGSSTSLYSRGIFNVRGYGRSHVYVFNDVKSVIWFKGIDQKNIFINFATHEETEAFYEMLHNHDSIEWVDHHVNCSCH